MIPSSLTVGLKRIFNICGLGLGAGLRFLVYHILSGGCGSVISRGVTVHLSGLAAIAKSTFEGVFPYVHIYTVPVKSLDTYSFKGFSLFFYYFLHCIIIVKTSKL